MRKLQRQNCRRGRIQRRLMAWGLGLLSLTLLINTFAGFSYTRRGMRESTARRQAGVAAFTARQLQNYLLHQTKLLEHAGAAMMLFPLGGEEQRRLGHSLLQGDAPIDEVAILDLKGTVILRLVAEGTRPKSPPSLPAFLAATAGSSSVKAIAGPSGSDVWRLLFAVPLRDSAGTSLGTLTACARVDFLRQVISDTDFGSGRNAYLIDDAGLLVLHSDPAFGLTNRDVRALPKVREFLAGQSYDANPAAEAIGIGGKTVLSTYARIPNLRWGIILEEPIDELIEKSQDLSMYATALLTAGLLVGAAILAGLSRRITRPLQELRDSVQIIRTGDLTHRARVKTGDEIEELAAEFNCMTAELEQATQTLEQRVAQRTQEIAALYEVTAMVSQTLDVEAVLDAVIQKITALFAFDTTRVYLYDSETHCYSLRGCFEVNPEPWINIASFSRGQSIVGKVVETGQPKIFEDLPNNAAYCQMSESRTAAKAGMGFLAVFPIITKYSCYGALVFSAKLSRSLNEGETRLLGSMAEQIGIAVENSALYQQARSQSAHLLVLNEVAAAVSRSLDLDTVLREALDKVVENLKFDAAWAYMMQPEERQLRLAAHKGLSSKTADMLAAQSRRGGIGRVLLSRERCRALEEETERERYRAVVSNRVQRSGYRGSITVPIKSRNRVIGVLYAVNWHSRRYTSDDLALMGSVAQEIGVAIENAKLFAETKKQSLELKEMNEELSAATQAKSEFIAAMSHELRTPLNIMIGNADLTHDGIFGEINEEQKSAMRKIARNGRVLLKMINDLLKLSRLEARRLSLDASEVAISEVLQHVRDQIAQLNRDERLQVGWHVDAHLPSLFTDAVKLEEIFHNLIGNAFKFTPAGRIDISVRNHPERRRVEFSVADTGIGIDPTNLDRIFETFEQIKTAGKSKNDGVGLGLSIVKKYLELMQGDICAESAPGKGSKFTFWLPYQVSLAAIDAAPPSQALTFQARNG
ncbi:MAG TPA: GAF domain-containing protein [Candidatus Binatia bacterium]|nr:GAF domain-containing protein [Candidatus Binatia bacterium]